MPALEFEPFLWIKKIIAVAVILQGLELLRIRRTYASDGIWVWATLRKEFEIFPGVFQRFLNVTLDYPHFLVLLLVQIGFALVLLLTDRSSPAVVICVLFASMLTSLRWRGTFNGGADYMTVLVLMILSIAELFRSKESVRLGCLWYLSIQTMMSYFIAGAVKFKNADWRTGRALRRFLSGPPYDPPAFFAGISKKPGLLLLGSWGVMLFELSFPLAIVKPGLCAGFLCMALVFHLLNHATFGLNRFLFAWSAAYPAILWAGWNSLSVFGSVLHAGNTLHC